MVSKNNYRNSPRLQNKESKNSPLKVAFISDSIYPYNKGGKEVRLHQIALELASQSSKQQLSNSNKPKIEVHIYTMKWWEGSADILQGGVWLHAISKKYNLYKDDRRSIMQGLLFGLSCLKMVIRKFDIVDVDHMPYFPLFTMKVVCALKRKKMFATWHEVWGKDYWQEYLPGLKGKIAYQMERFSAKLPSSICAVSDLTANRLKKILNYDGPCTVVGVGVDQKIINLTAASKITSDLIYSGRLLRHKNVDLVIRATAILKQKYPNIKCLITGEGPEKDKLIRLADQLELKNNVSFLDFLPNKSDVYSLWKSSKVFVSPSSREGFGMTVLEANACGLLVVTSECPNNASRFLITEGQNGYLSKPNEKHLAAAIFNALNHKPNEKNNLVLPILQWDFIAKQLLQVYSI